MGYYRAGFDVVGVDSEKQPRYPFDFVQADALEYLDRHGSEFDVIHASPPCRDHTVLAARVGKGTVETGWLLPAIRDRLIALGRPWVVENVPGAPMRKDLTLCGGMFGLRTYRHRWFESSVYLERPEHPPHTIRTSTKKRRSCWDAGLHASVTGHVGTYVGRLAMGIEWMTAKGLSQAIPPVYTEFIGYQLIDYLSGKMIITAREEPQ